MRIDTLKSEINSLRKSNEKDVDSLRIKTKIVEDQTETIKKMKEALNYKDNEVVFWIVHILIKFFKHSQINKY